jgi:ABC-type Mn2+/Zn2+ transport system ATPase subunit
VGLVGPNGSGKTTFLKTALGLIPVLGGTVHRDSARRFAYVPQAQDLNFLWPITVREAVSLAVRSKRFYGRATPGDRARIDAAMEKTGVAPIADMLLRDASGGQRQRAILAQALSQEPDVILMDEPTRGLDVVAERGLLSLIEDLKSQKMAILLVTHTLHIPLNLADRILLFAGGSVVASTPGELMSTDKLEKIYGVPFLKQEAHGVKSVSPARSAP